MLMILILGIQRINFNTVVSVKNPVERFERIFGNFMDSLGLPQGTSLREHSSTSDRVV